MRCTLSVSEQVPQEKLADSIFRQEPHPLRWSETDFCRRGQPQTRYRVDNTIGASEPVKIRNINIFRVLGISGLSETHFSQQARLALSDCVS